MQNVFGFPGWLSLLYLAASVAISAWFWVQAKGQQRNQRLWLLAYPALWIGIFLLMTLFAVRAGAAPAPSWVGVSLIGLAVLSLVLPLLLMRPLADMKRFSLLYGYMNAGIHVPLALVGVSAVTGGAWL